jgi:hypothetical protein
MEGSWRRYLPCGALIDGKNLRLKLRFTLVGGVVLPAGGVLSTPNCDFLQLALQLPLACGLKEQCGGGCGDVQGIDVPEAGQGYEAIASCSYSGTDAFALAA